MITFQKCISSHIFRTATCITQDIYKMVHKIHGKLFKNVIVHIHDYMFLTLLPITHDLTMLHNEMDHKIQQ